MKWTLENALPAGFVLAVAALCAAGFTSYFSTQEFAEAGKAVAQSQEIFRELESTMLAVKEMEARQLTVLASGTETTPPSPAEVSAIGVKFSRLKELASGDAGRVERVQDLERSVAREVELLRQISDTGNDQPTARLRGRSNLANGFRRWQAKFGRPQQRSLAPRSRHSSRIRRQPRPRPACHPSLFSPCHHSPWFVLVWPFTNSLAICRRGVVQWSNYATVRNDTGCWPTTPWT